MQLERYSHIILMKVGPYCGYSLDQIIDIKQKEQDKVGKYFWGYSGVFCRPLVVKNLVSNAGAEGVKILFVETKSDFVPETYEKFSQYSKDGSAWEGLPEDVLLVGNRKKPHFAITGKDLKEEDFQLDLTQYCTLKGLFINENQRFDSYFKYRVDKACGVYLPTEVENTKFMQVKYSSNLVDPYVVSVR